jgi:hypothetical protein
MKDTDKFNRIAKIGENFTVNMYDNGFMLEFNGLDAEGNYIQSKVMCSTVEDVLALVIAAVSMDKE